MAYKVIETDERVEDGRPALITRFSWRARRRCRKLNEQRLFNLYRYEVQYVNGKWEVVAMQNVALPFIGGEQNG